MTANKAARVQAHNSASYNIVAAWLGIPLAEVELRPRRRPHHKTTAHRQRGHSVGINQGSRRQLSLL